MYNDSNWGIIAIPVNGITLNSGYCAISGTSCADKFPVVVGSGNFSLRDYGMLQILPKGKSVTNKSLYPFSSIFCHISVRLAIFNLTASPFLL